MLILQNLYNANVRNVVVMGLAPIGCAPYYLWLHNRKDGHCVEKINDMVLEFNFAMRFTVEELTKELPDAKIIFCDAFEGSMDIMKNNDRYGEIIGRVLVCISLEMYQYHSDSCFHFQVLMSLMMLAVD